MKRVTAFVGSARKKSTYNAVCQFLENLQSLGDIEYEIVIMSDYRLGTCRGCCLCFDKGEKFCPLKDDRDVLIEKIVASDGVVFASPELLVPGLRDHEDLPRQTRLRLPSPAVLREDLHQHRRPRHLRRQQDSEVP